MWASLLATSYRRYRLNTRLAGRCDSFGLALLVSTVGILLAGFNSDSLRFFGYWIVLGLGWVYVRPKTKVANP